MPLRILGFTLCAAFVVLLATGLWLIWNYRPDEAAIWANVRHLRGMEWVRRIRTIHRIAGEGTAISGVAFGLLMVVDSIRRRRWFSVPPGVLTMIVIPLAAFSGVLLAWDQLGLWAVTVGTDLSGFGFLFEHQVRSIYVGSSQISVDTFQRWFWVHTVALPILFIVLVGLTLRSNRRTALPSPAEPDADVGTRHDGHD